MNSIRSISSVGLNVSDRVSKACCTPVKVAHFDLANSVLTQLDEIDPTDEYYLGKPTPDHQGLIKKILRKNNSSEDLIVTANADRLRRILSKKPSRYFFL
jgi:hypothetical protein